LWDELFFSALSFLRAEHVGEEFPVLEVVLSKKQQEDNTQMSPFDLLLVSRKTHPNLR